MSAPPEIACDVPAGILGQARPPPPYRAESATCDRGAQMKRGRGDGSGVERGAETDGTSIGT